MAFIATRQRSALVKHDESFAPELRSAEAARKFVRNSLASHGVVSDDGELIVSELVGNVVQHARTPITVKLHVGQRLRIEVHDGNAIIPAMVDAAEDAESGRGLFIIEALATQWGIEATSAGKFVWAETTAEES